MSLLSDEEEESRTCFFCNCDLNTNLSLKCMNCGPSSRYGCPFCHHTLHKKDGLADHKFKITNVVDCRFCHAKPSQTELMLCLNERCLSVLFSIKKTTVSGLVWTCSVCLMSTKSHLSSHVVINTQNMSKEVSEAASCLHT